ncbi:MAG: hypothetical protein HYZ83_06760 [Candidatus Omnitrophica bacterium]|nr:hypothetical protein [Candidatus Omnitrophota bacterium]
MMKKIIFWALLFVMFAAVALNSPLYAEENKGMRSGKMMGMHMMKMMTEKSVVATSDGGVVVVAGNKITKYDKDLNVVKEAEIKMDMEAMAKHMKEMMEQCPMMKGKEGSGEEKAAASEEKAAPSEEESHH